MSIVLLSFQPDEFDRAYVDQTRQLAGGMRVVVTAERANIEGMLDEIEVIAGFGVPYDLLQRMPKLRWMQQWGAGADRLLRHPAAAAMPFTLTNASGVHAVPISEQILGYMLMFARGLHHAVRAQQRNEWWRPQRSEVFELAGKTLLLIGVGAIGEHTALVANALGMRVEGIRRDATQHVAGVAAMYGPEALAARLPQADMVVLTVPLIEETRNLIDAAALARMKPTSYLINIGRGGTIDETALAAALRSGQIAGAALDVFAEEPLPAASPLWVLDNLITTGHYAGNTQRYHERSTAIFFENLRRYRAGEPLINLVDKQIGY
ncbi:MAG TPA: D-2-hydroxyacid dehydrogenase [Roseiflexaceae bacterium]|nr:D-2-hydroxyacid dehydrogenase [Roseiflexaceae bacterium]